MVVNVLHAWHWLLPPADVLGCCCCSLPWLLLLLLLLLPLLQLHWTLHAVRKPER